MPQAKGFQIAIDGPVAAGKSTAAQLLAERLGFTYVDTGAMYRAIALLAIRKGIGTDDEAALTQLVHDTEIDVKAPSENEKDGRLSTVLVNGEDVSWIIRSKEVSNEVAKVAALPQVREALVEKQQIIANTRDVVMEGRDITYVVLPEAELKIFMDASPEERSQRYYLKMNTPEKPLSLEEASQMLKDRDELDKNRTASPLKLIPGVWHLDTSGLSIDQVIDMIVAKVDQMRRS